MSDTQNSVMQKFARLRDGREALRRADFKGDRRRLNIRISVDLAVDLELVRIVGNISKSEFAERVLRAALADELQILRQRHDQKTWENLTALAKEKIK